MILSKTGSLYRQPNLFPLFLSISSALEHELKTHISGVLKTVYLLLVQIGCFHIFKKFFNSATNHTLPYRYGAERGIHTFHFIEKGGCDFETIRLPKDNGIDSKWKEETSEKT